jgi:hypothetical protein
MSRPKRFAFAVAASLGLGVGVAFAFIAFFVLTAIAFSGSTGAALTQFWNSLMPVGHFVVGAALGACAVGLLNSVVVDEGVWWLGMILAALVLGVAAAAVPALGKSLVALIAPLTALVGKVVLRH